MYNCCEHSFEICNCECHRSNNCYHITACCYTCDICNKRIQPFYYDEHVKKCTEKFKTEFENLP